LLPNAEAEVAIQVTVEDFSASSGGAAIFDSGSLWTLSRFEQEFVFEFTSPRFGRLPYKRACFRPDFSGGTITMQRGYFAGASVDALEYPLDELLMMNLLAQGRGVEVHACAVRDCNGRGYLFLGQSGAGKTTTARLWQNLSGIEILSDDRVILRRVQETLWMYGTPWHGEAALVSSMQAPVSAVYFLAQGQRNQMTVLRQAEAVGRFMACSFVPFYSSAGLEHALDFFQQLTAQLPCHELRFVPNAQLVELVRQKGP
jgi:hypothetical protein